MNVTPVSNNRLARTEEATTGNRLVNHSQPRNTDDSFEVAPATAPLTLTSNRATNDEADTATTGELLSTTSTELDHAAETLTLAATSPEPSEPSLPPGSLTANADGSITTPGGYIIHNDGNYQWRIESPAGIISKIHGDPHVDQDNDGKDDWHFNQDGTFILPDGTKIFCDTDKTGETGGQDITVSVTLKIQYEDSLGTMDTKNGGPGTVGEGGLAYDSSTADGQLYVMGSDNKFYDGETLGQLYDAGGDFARDVDGNIKGILSAEALLSLNKTLEEQGLPPVTNGIDGENNAKIPTADQLALLLALEDNAQVVDDSDGAVTTAAKKKGKIPDANVLGKANDALEGYTGLAKLDANGDGVVSGAELQDVKVWIDANNDGNAEDSEIKLLAEFNVDTLKVKLEIKPNDDGTTQMNGEFIQNGVQVGTSDDRITPLNTGAQAENFQLQLNKQIGEDRGVRALASARLRQTIQQLDLLEGQRQETLENQRLRSHADTRHLNLLVGGARA